MPQRPQERIVVLPNPTLDGAVEIRYASEDRVELMATYDVRGSAVNGRSERRPGGLWLMLPATPGIYLVHLRVNGAPVLQRIVRR